MGKLTKYEKSIYDYLKEMRNKASIELFNKNESELTIVEVKILDHYMFDLAHPEWRPIVYGGKSTTYMINNVGEVKNIMTDNIRVLKVDTNGYYYVDFTPINDVLRTIRIHRLVADAFIPNPNNKPIVNHKNGNKLCNWVGNLEWATQQENFDHAVANGLITFAFGEDNPSSKHKECDVHKICKLLEQGISVGVISNTFGIPYSTINDIKQGNTWRHISSHYKIPAIIANADKLRAYMEELIYAGYSNKEIIKFAGLPNTTKQLDYVKHFRKSLFDKTNST